jgi:hypothetical protein
MLAKMYRWNRWAMLLTSGGLLLATTCNINYPLVDTALLGTITGLLVFLAKHV